MLIKGESFRVAAIQASPVYGDPPASVEKAARLIQQAAARGARIAAFGEAWLSGYPLHALAPAAGDVWWETAGDYLALGIDVPGPETQALCDAARAGGIDVVIGVCERDPMTRGTLYSTLLFIGSEGEVLARHRKLRPAPHERAVWGDGDAIDLKVHQRDYALISGLSGCEHQMALPVFALAEQGAQLHIAAWPGYEAPDPKRASFFPPSLLLSRAFAAQAGCYVLSVGCVLAPTAMAAPWSASAAAGFTGGSAVIDPRGEIVAGPASGETILYVDCMASAIRTAKVAFDLGGHSARRDQLKLWTPAIGADDHAMNSGMNSGMEGGIEGGMEGGMEGGLPAQSGPGGWSGQPPSGKG